MGRNTTITTTTYSPTITLLLGPMAGQLHRCALAVPYYHSIIYGVLSTVVIQCYVFEKCEYDAPRASSVYPIRAKREKESKMAPSSLIRPSVSLISNLLYSSISSSCFLLLFLSLCVRLRLRFSGRLTGCIRYGALIGRTQPTAVSSWQMLKLSIIPSSTATNLSARSLATTEQK